MTEADKPALVENMLLLRKEDFVACAPGSQNHHSLASPLLVNPAP